MKLLLYPSMRPQADPDGVVRYKLKDLPGASPAEEIRHKVLNEVVLFKHRATDEQIDFALSLLARTGYSTDLTDSGFEDFGLPFELEVNVESWLASLSIPKIGFLIDYLKGCPLEFDFNKKEPRPENMN